VSILRIELGIFEVLSTNGDTFLGGDDLDRAITDHWISEKNLTLDTASKRGEIRLLAERAKKQLSSQDSFTAEFHGATLYLDRDLANVLFTPLVKRTLASCGRALKDAELTTWSAALPGYPWCRKRSASSSEKT